MSVLSKDLIDQFVKITNDVTDQPRETTVRATVSSYEGDSIFVLLDGMTGDSNPIPIESTVAVKSGDKVIVTIKKHEAIITGNISSMSASQSQVADVDKTLTDAVSNIIGPDQNVYEIMNSNTALQFKDGGLVAAEVKDQGFRMLNAEVQNELKMGQFLWVQHSGNLGLLWRGENNNG